MNRQVRRLLVSLLALVLALGVSQSGLNADPESCFICGDELGDYCDDTDECPWDPAGVQCFHLACSQICGTNPEAIRCSDYVPECDLEIQIECTDEVS